MQQSILAGRRVLELGTMLAAPFAAHLLGQLGAEVIKIEPPAGDPTRTLVRGGPGGTFLAYNRGKRSLCIDLTTPAGQAVFRQLLGTADVVLHNLSPSAARRLGVTYESCIAANPDLVYCHIKGYGPGPQADDIASNPVAEASTGVMYGHRIDGRPTRLGPSHHDQFAGAYAVIGILAAFGGGARRLEFGLYETGLHMAARDLLGVQLKTQLTGESQAQPSGEFSMPGYGAYETADGRWIYLVMLTDAHWQKFWQAMQRPEDVDESLATLRQRKKQRPLVESLVRSAIGALAFDAAAQRLRAAGFGFTEVLEPSQVLQAGQARHPPKFSEMSFQGYHFEAPDFPLHSEFGSRELELPPPLLGEHTREILGSLGYDAARCDALLAQGAVHAGEAPERPLWAPPRTGQVRPA